MQAIIALTLGRVRQTTAAGVESSHGSQIKRQACHSNEVGWPFLACRSLGDFYFRFARDSGAIPRATGNRQNEVTSTCHRVAVQ